MALWMRGGIDWSWTLHLQSAQWVVLVTTSFSPSHFISRMLLAWSPHFPHAPRGFFRFHLSRSWLISTFLKGLSLFLTCQVFSFALTFSSPLFFFPLSKARYSQNFWTVLDSAPKLFSLGKSSGLSRVAWRVAVRGQLDTTELDCEPWPGQDCHYWPEKKVSTFGGPGHLACLLDVAFFNMNLLSSLALLLSHWR